MTKDQQYAVTFTAPKAAALLPVDADTTPLGPGEVYGRTVASLISAGTELSGPYQGTSFPVVPGYAAVFEIEAIGEAVTTLKPGDIALTMGPHRSYQRAAESGCFLLPDGLAPQKATFARMMSISMSTLTTTTARPPQTVLVMGLGPVGHIAAKVFASAGYEVVGCDPSVKRRAILRQSEIDVIPSIDDAPDLAGNVSLVVECSGHEQAALDGCKVIRRGGEVVLIGVPWHRLTDIYAHDILTLVFHNYVHLRSGWEWELPVAETDFRTGSIHANLAAALGWLAEGRVKVDRLWEGRRPADAQAVYDDLLNGRTESLAVMFEW